MCVLLLTALMLSTIGYLAVRTGPRLGLAGRGGMLLGAVLYAAVTLVFGVAIYLLLPSDAPTRLADLGADPGELGVVFVAGSIPAFLLLGATGILGARWHFRVFGGLTLLGALVCLYAAITT